MRTELLTQLQAAKQASFSALLFTTEKKNAVLQTLGTLLEAQKDNVLEANRKDIEHATKQGKDDAFIDRLTLNDSRFVNMIQGINDIIALDDPIGKAFDERTVQDNLKLYKLRVPLGVILLVFEARPNVIIDVAALAIKSGNVCLAKGGSSAHNANAILSDLVQQALKKEGVNENFFQYLALENHDELNEVLQQETLIDLVIPRGGEGLVRRVAEHSKIPVIKHYQGINHIYIDKSANLEDAWGVSLNAKVNRPATCNAVETLLVHQAIADAFLPPMIKQFREQLVEVRGDEITRRYNDTVVPASDKDWDTEFLNLTIAVKVVASLQEAVKFINKHGSQHTESIMTEDKAAAKEFIDTVDAGVVFVNASTRLNDGNQFGMGAELGISTGKLHARGPMALEEMTTYKWVGWGHGNVRK